MAFALIIKDEYDNDILEHVSNHMDDSVHVEDYEAYGLPQAEWRKAHHLTDWVKNNKPGWLIRKRVFSPIIAFAYED